MRSGAWRPRLVAEKLDDPSRSSGPGRSSSRPRRRTPPETILDRFAVMARDDRSPVVRLYLASAAQRLPWEQRSEIVGGLVGHGEDERDPNLPLMYWYAAEPLATVDTRRAARLAASSPISLIREYMARRIGAIGTPESLAILVRELGRAGGSPMLRPSWPGSRKACGPSSGGDARGMAGGLRPAGGRPGPAGPVAAMSLALLFGDPRTGGAPRDPRRSRGRTGLARENGLAALLKAKDASLPDQLHGLILDPALGGPAVRGLSAYDDPATPRILLESYEKLGRFAAATP